MVFLVGGANSATGYEIENSLRFEGAAATGLARFGNNSRDGNTFTISAWIKRAKLGRTELFNSKVEDSGVNSPVMMFNSDDKLSVIGQPASGTGAGGNRTVALTSAVYRDLSAWYHVVYRQDTTDGTAGNRHRIYVNGVQQTLGTNDALDQNVGWNTFYNASSYPFAIANDERDNSYGSFYIAEHHYTDGVSNGPDAFGETNDNGVWIPKEYTGSHGSYGHYLKFENSGGGSGTTSIGGHDYTTGSSSTIGADSSGNDNHFHVQGYSAEDNTTDTPTNNFCTLNPLDTNSNHTFSEGNCKIAYSASAGNFGVTKSTMGVAKGKWYWEIKYNYGNAGQFGVFDINDTETNTADIFTAAGNSTFEGLAWRIDSSNNIKECADGQTDDTNVDFSSDNILGIAFDADNGKIYGYNNGTELTSQDISAGTSLITAVTVSDFYLPFISNGDGGSGTKTGTSEINFGNPTFSISSGNSDANGYGNFEYAVPSGYYALCTKNLAEYG